MSARSHIPPFGNHETKYDAYLVKYVCACASEIFNPDTHDYIFLPSKFQIDLYSSVRILSRGDMQTSPHCALYYFFLFAGSNPLSQRYANHSTLRAVLFFPICGFKSSLAAICKPGHTARCILFFTKSFYSICEHAQPYIF